MGSGPNWYQTGNKTCYVPKVGKFRVEKGYLKVAGLKVAPFASKCVFYRPEHNAKRGPHEIEF